MKRQLKFRAWDTKTKTMLQEVPNQHSFTISADTGEIQGIHYGWEGSEDPAHFEIMQFTGLLDKNGKEIFEGDFLQLNEYGEGTYKEVVFHNGCFCVHGFNWDRRTAEVIGNIYENPNLL